MQWSSSRKNGGKKWMNEGRQRGRVLSRFSVTFATRSATRSRTSRRWERPRATVTATSSLPLPSATAETSITARWTYRARAVHPLAELRLLRAQRRSRVTLENCPQSPESFPFKRHFQLQYDLTRQVGWNQLELFTTLNEATSVLVNATLLMNDYIFFRNEQVGKIQPWGGGVHVGRVLRRPFSS